jgi:hypothetical protein
MLGEVYERHGAGQEGATEFYTQIVKDYPLSPLAEAAKQKLQQYSVTIPEPDPQALARMQQEQQVPRDRPGILGRALGMLKTGPDVSMAARAGTPTMTPPEQETQDSLIRGLPGTLGSTSAGTSSGIAVETVPPTPTERPPQP